jgi:hypothetical protein
MGATKEMYLEMRAQEIVQMYDTTFTKKEAVKTGLKLAQSVFDDGLAAPEDVLANLSRLKWVVDAAESKLRAEVEIYDKRVVLGLEFNYVQGGNTLNVTEDGRYNDLKLALDRRVELLKLAQKQETTDPYNNYDAVPKVSTSPRKSSITIK